MCKPEPLAWDSAACFERLSSRLPQASSSWWRNLWKRRAERWQEMLGDTLRVETCLPIATGSKLRELLAEELSEYRVSLPDECTAELIDANKGPLTNGRKGTQKLTRYLSQLVRQQLFTADGEKQLADKCAAIVSNVFQAVQSHNGLKLVLSANPLDILDSGHYANYGSCHAWDIGYGGPDCRAAGTFALSATPDVLVAYLWKQTAHDVGKPRHDATPWKEWRQLIYPTTNGVIFAREYGSALLDFRHAILRRLVAETLGGKGCDWSYKRTTLPGQVNYADDGPYAGDTLTGLLRITGKHGDGCACFNVGHTVCPSCGGARPSPKSESILCPDCGGEDLTRRCGDCREDVAVSNEDDWDEWLSIDGRPICPSCAENYSYCEGCNEYALADDMREVTNHRGRSVYRCLGCLDFDEGITLQSFDTPQGMLQGFVAPNTDGNLICVLDSSGAGYNVTALPSGLAFSRSQLFSPEDAATVAAEVWRRLGEYTPNLQSFVTAVQPNLQGIISNSVRDCWRAATDAIPIC